MSKPHARLLPLRRQFYGSTTDHVAAVRQSIGRCRFGSAATISVAQCRWVTGYTPRNHGLIFAAQSATLSTKMRDGNTPNVRSAKDRQW